MWNPLLSSNVDWPGHWLWVLPAHQRLRECAGSAAGQEFLISTAQAGLGEEQHSGRTPRGWHYIRARIGADLPADAILRGRRWQPDAIPGNDPILARILWLCGLESGRNRGGRVDSFRRYIYLHGTADRQHLGKPVSQGCIRMDPEEIIQLFPRCPVGTPVFIGDCPTPFPWPQRNS